MIDEQTEARAIAERWQKRADNARKTLDLKAKEAAKGHDWVVAHEVIQCDEIIAVTTALAAKDAGLEGWKRTATEYASELHSLRSQLAEAQEELNVLRANQIAHVEARARLTDQLAEARKALEPFAWIGQWLFARDLPDETPVVMVEGAGKPFALTRGMFKAAHTAARRAREAQGASS